MDVETDRIWCDKEGRQRTGEMGRLARECCILPANRHKLEEARKILPYSFQREQDPTHLTLDVQPPEPRQSISVVLSPPVSGAALQ